VNALNLPAIVVLLKVRPSVPWGTLGVAATFLALLAACGGGADSATLIVTDSAGVEIVQHPADATVPLWSLGQEPQVKVGVVTGDPEYQFQGVVAAIRDEEGRLVVLDRSRRRISVFGPDGGFVGASGREGRGPGEYDRPSALWRLPGDSLAVYDPAVGRVSILNEDAGWVRSVQVQPIGTLVLPSGSFGDGSLLVVNAFPDPGQTGMASSYTVSPKGIESLAEFRHIENQEPGPMSSVRRPLIAKVARMSASGDFLFLVRNVDHEIQIQDSEGALRRIIRWHGRDLTATREEQRRYIDNIIENIPEERRTTHRASLEALTPNERFPPFERIHADREGRAWVQTFRRPSDTGPREWWVVAHTGEIAGRIEIPERAVVLDAAEDYVLLLLFDELGVQSVAQFGLDRGSGYGS